MDNNILIIGHHNNFPPQSKRRTLRNNLCSYLIGIGYKLKIIDSNANTKNMYLDIKNYNKIIDFEETFDDRTMEQFGVKSLNDIEKIFENKNVIPNLNLLRYTSSKIYYNDIKNYILPNTHCIKKYNKREFKKNFIKCIGNNNKFHIVVKFGYSGERHGYYEFTNEHENFFKRNEYGDAGTEPEYIKYKTNNVINEIVERIDIYAKKYINIINCDLPLIIQPFNIHISDRNNERRCLIFNGIKADRFAKGKYYEYEKYIYNNPEHIKIMELADIAWKFMKNKFSNDCFFIRCDIGYYIDNDIKKFYINEIEGLDASMYFADNPHNNSWYETQYYQELLSGIIAQQVMLWGGNTIPKQYLNYNNIMNGNKYINIEDGISPLNIESKVITTNDELPHDLPNIWNINSVKLFIHNTDKNAYLYYIKKGMIGTGRETMEWVINLLKYLKYEKLYLKDGVKNHMGIKISALNYLYGKMPYYYQYNFIPNCVYSLPTNKMKYPVKNILSKKPSKKKLEDVINNHPSILKLIKCCKRINKYTSDNYNKNCEYIYIEKPKNIKENINWINKSTSLIIKIDIKYIMKIFIDILTTLEMPYKIICGDTKIGLFNFDMWKMKQFSYFINNSLWIYDITKK